MKNKNDTLEFLMESTKPIVFHTGYRDISRIKNLEFFIKNSSKPIALAHAGDLINSDLELISKYENVFIDVSPMQTMLDQNYFINSSRRSRELKDLDSQKVLNYLDNLFGKERIVWGSDSPWSDNLIEDGYAKEVSIGRLMERKGFKFSYLDFT